MNHVAKFEKISLNEWSKQRPTEEYDKIILPRRATVGSAGYDFYAPFPFTLKPNESLIIPTGIRVLIDEGWVLNIYPRSGLGFKYRLRLDNTVGIIDSDYYNALNEGHIMIKITNETNDNKTIEIKEGEAFAQGVFLMYGITYDDNTIDKRTGGFGSTTKQK